MRQYLCHLHFARYLYAEEKQEYLGICIFGIITRVQASGSVYSAFVPLLLFFVKKDFDFAFLYHSGGRYPRLSAGGIYGAQFFRYIQDIC